MRPVVLMLAAHEPDCDPRVIWEAEYAGDAFEVILIGLQDWQQEKPAEEVRSCYRLIRLQRIPARGARAAFLKSLARLLLPRWLVVLLGIAAACVLPLVLPAYLVCMLLRLLRVPGASSVTQSRCRSLLKRALRALPGARAKCFLSKTMWHLNTCSVLWVATSNLQEKPAVIHCNDLETLIVGVLAGRAFGCRVVLDSHEFWPHSDVDAAWWEVRLYVAYERWLIRKADRVFTVNPLLAEEMKKTYRGVEIGSVPNAAPLPPAPDQRGVPARITPKPFRQVTFLFQGAFAPQRGLEEIIRAWRQIDPERAVLLLRGKDNEWKTACCALAQELGLLDRSVFFPPPVTEDQLVEAAQIADVGVIPYKPVCLNYAFCCPNKLSQYMQAGLPILAANTAYVESVLTESQAGICYEPGDEASIVAAVARLIDDAPFRQRCADHAARFVQTVFHWQQLSRPLYAAYRELSARAATASPSPPG